MSKRRTKKNRASSREAVTVDDLDLGYNKTLRTLERPKVFWPVVCGLLFLMGALMVHSALGESYTMDEPVYIGAGYCHWTLGNFEFTPEHPPLAKLIIGLGVLSANPRVDRSLPGWAEGHPADAPRDLIFRSGVEKEKILTRARLPFILITLAFGLALVMWTRSHFGALAAVAALVFFSLDANILAHGRYAATDMLTVVLLFLSCITWDRYLRTGRRTDLVLSGIILGLALMSKFSCLILLGLLPIIGLLRWAYLRERGAGRRLLTGLLLAGVIAVVLLAASYGPATTGLITGDSGLLHHRLRDSADRDGLYYRLARELEIPYHPYLYGLHWQWRHNEDGHRAYLLGEISQKGWWYYFPVAFLVKTPSAILIGLLAYLVLALFWPRTKERKVRYWRSFLILPPLLLFLIACQANIDIGHRYILPIYPFLYVLIAARFARPRAWIALPALALLLAAETAMVAPHYLAFFNSPSGGSGNGPKYLLDSNIDWGQDVWKVASFIEDRGSENVCCLPFTPISAGEYGVRCKYPRPYADEETIRQMNCLAVVSVNHIYGLSREPDEYEYLREREPVGKIGYTNYVYDLRQHDETGSGEK